MKKATINIEITEDAEEISFTTDFHGEMFLIMRGLTNAINILEKHAPEGSGYRADILELLNERY